MRCEAVRPWFRTIAIGAVLWSVALPAASQSHANGVVPLARRAFGITVALAEGDVLVGEPANRVRPGTVYVYRRGNAGWRESAQIRAANAAASDGFGSDLAFEGTTLIVGASSQDDARGAAFVFQRNGNEYVQTARLTASDGAPGDQFGSTVAVFGDIALVGAPYHAEQSGAVYVFRRTATGWTQTAKLRAGAPQPQALFGTAIALTPDRAFIGAPVHNQGRGVVVIFDRNAATDSWRETNIVTHGELQTGDHFGMRLAVQGTVLFVGAPFTHAQAGAVYVYQHDGSGGWPPSGRVVGYDATQGYTFGTAIAAAANELWIGASSASGARGAVYRHRRAADGITFDGARKLMPSVPLVQGASFGAAVALRGDVAAVGMVGDDNGAGTVVVFERSGDEWVQRAVLESPPEALASVRGREVRCGQDKHAAGFGCQNVELLSFLSIPDLGGDRGTALNDIWGWTDAQSGKEYALVGRTNGTSFVDVSDPVNPVYIGNLPLTEGASAASWRDIKVHRDHAYIVADGAGPHGVQVFDLTRLRGFRGTPLELAPDLVYRRVNSAHNIVINEATGYAFSVGGSSGGETCGGGLHMIDIREPKNPQFAGCFADPQTGRSSTGYSHDAQCVTYRGPDQRYQGREICLGSNETALSIADVTDKANPKALSRATYPNPGYSHQGWLTEDQRYFYMDDELDELAGTVAKTRTLIWDVADLEDPKLVGSYLGVEGATDHNLYIRDNLMYQSNYKSGLRIIDITNREQPREVAYFDTAPYGSNGSGFEGSWSNYPFFKSGIIIVSSIGEGLFVLRKRQTGAVF